MNDFEQPQATGGAISDKSGQMRLDGRNEKRVTMAIAVCLAIAKDLLFAYQAMTVNVSPHGARIITRRRWQLDERPRLASSSGELGAPAQVIYCEPLTNGHYCIGLRFPSAITDWKST